MSIFSYDKKKNRKFDHLKVEIYDSASTGIEFRVETLTDVTFEITSKKTTINTLKKARAGCTFGTPVLNLSGKLAVTKELNLIDILRRSSNEQILMVKFNVGGSDSITSTGIITYSSGAQTANGNYEITFNFEGTIDPTSFNPTGF
jgi:hypothetical protein